MRGLKREAKKWVRTAVSSLDMCKDQRVSERDGDRKYKTEGKKQFKTDTLNN